MPVTEASNFIDTSVDENEKASETKLSGAIATRREIHDVPR